MKNLISLILFITMIGLSNTFSQSTIDNRFIEFTLTGGAWLNIPTTIYFERTNSEFKKSVSPLIKAMGDVYLNKHFAIGLYLNYSPYNHPNLTNSTPTTINTFEYGAGFKPVFYLSEKTALKVGANVGLRKMISDSENLTGKGLGVNASFEIQHQLSNTGAITFEPGFLAQPIGFTGPGVKTVGATIYEYSYPPIFYLNIGYSFFSTRK